MSDVLEQICAATRVYVEREKAIVPLPEMDLMALGAAAPRGFVKALQAKLFKNEIGLITEIKKASPSAGVIRPYYSPTAIARSYETAGAACLSVLTDVAFFQGRNADLVEARAACALPVLRKDFMLDVWQVAEARSIGADCILLIMAAIDDTTALKLHKAATGYGMDVLIEVHNREELNRALALPHGLIGINNRNLKTLKTDLGTTEELAPFVPKDRILVCESGIGTASDIQRMRKTNAHCFLVGESLLKQGDITKAVNALRAPSSTHA